MTLLIFFSNGKLQYQNTAEPTHLLATFAVGMELLQDVSVEEWGRGHKANECSQQIEAPAPETK